MRNGRLLKANDKTCLIEKVSRTTNFLDRMRGLLFRPTLKMNEALLIKPCNSIHTMGMTYPLDLVFLDKDWTVLKSVSNLKPWRSASYMKANMVLELTSGSIETLNLLEGQQLEWHDEP